MIELNRKIQPKFNSINSIDYLKPQKFTLNNGIPVYSINSGNDDVIKLDILFPAGIWYQDQSLISSFTSLMLMEGTQKLSSKQIAEKLDYYGSYIYPYIEKDNAGVTLYCLHKHFERTVSVLQDILGRSAFHDTELDIQIQNRKQQFLIDSEKVNVLSLKRFNKHLFGENHPYGRSANIGDYDMINRELLVGFYKKFYNLNHSKIIISGRVNDEDISILDKTIGSMKPERSDNLIDRKFDIVTSSESTSKYYKQDAVQSSIRLGKLLFNKLHPDFMGVQILNLVFGGYFGSRLMNNIREDKGYTYGIGSSIISLHNAGYISISTEAGSEYVDNILKEIKIEMEILQNELIPIDELQRARNYFLGDIVRGFDGPFEMADSFKSILQYGLDYDYFDVFIDTINTISAIQLQELAGKYFDYNSFKVIIAGG